MHLQTTIFATSFIAALNFNFQNDDGHFGTDGGVTPSLGEIEVSCLLLRHKMSKNLVWFPSIW